MTDPRTINVSWSQLRVHEECAQRAKLLREGHRSPAGDLRNYFPGMIVDSIMGRWLDDPDRKPGGMLVMLENAIDELVTEAAASGDGIVRWKHPGDRDEVRRFCAELLTRLEPLLERLILPYPFDGHRRFKVPIYLPYLDGSQVIVNLTGETDLRTREGEGSSIWDLKGTADNSYWRKVVGQLIFYDVVETFETTRKPRRVGLIQPMCTNPVLQWTITDDQRRALLARVMAYAVSVWRNQAPCKEGTHGCTFCNVRHACPRFAGTGRTVSLGQPDTLAAALRAGATT